MLFHDKNTQTRNRRELSQPDKGNYEKSTANNIILNLNVGRLNTFPLRSETRQGSALITFIQHCVGGSTQGNQVRKRNKRHPDWEGRKLSLFSDDIPTKKLLASRQVRQGCTL